MLVVLMYHQVENTCFPSTENALENHLSFLARQYSVVTPGDNLSKHQHNVCLTFDDAYADFYFKVFPLLKKLNMKAVLAIPAGMIAEETDLEPATRLQTQNNLNSCQNDTALCTWKEINEMLASGYVVPASHGLNHLPLTQLTDLTVQEITESKQLLEEKTAHKVETFVYPYGKMSPQVNRFVHQHYRFSMRIGSSMNRDWHNFHQVIYRINADDFWPVNRPLLTPSHQVALKWRFLSNSLRFK